MENMNIINKMKKNRSPFFKRLKDEYIGQTFAWICGIIIIALTISIIGFVTVKGIKTFTSNGYSLFEFIFSSKWNPEAEIPQFGSLSYILGSTFVSFGAVLISAPISVALAIFMNYISPNIGKNVLQPAMELFVGVPSVVYGWVGITVVVPMIKGLFGGLGFSLLAGIIVLSIMILPTICSISADAFKVVPRSYLEASYGLGATRWQTISNVLLPAAKPKIYTGIVLGLARAFGEALAVTMVIGNTVRLPFNILKPMATLTGGITMDMANTFYGTDWNDALWSLAFVLLVVSFIFILIIRGISKRGEKL